MNYSKANPCYAKIKDRYRLNKPGSTKETYHITLDLKGAPFHFQTGDSIAVLPQNDPKVVSKILDLLHASGEESIVDIRSQTTTTLQSYLTNNLNLVRVNSSLAELTLKHQAHAELASLLDPNQKEAMREHLASHTVPSFLAQYPCALPLQEFCQTLSPLLPRFYSIASSLQKHPEEVHLTVALFTLNEKGEKRFGVASNFLCQLAEKDNTPIPIYVQKAHSFTLPENDETPIIMVGPGTGIAPFRAFMQERLHRNAKGKNWLFFGERHRHFDFFYEEFWHGLKEQEFLHLHTAFSRDQEEKIYVQHRMYEEKKALWSWIENGAVIYVCGDANQMAKDVEKTLQMIIQEEGNLNEEESKKYLKNLRAQKRYLLDVY